MTNNLTRKAFFEKYGFKMTNPNWAWSGVHSEEKLVIFTAWEHYKRKNNGKLQYLIFCDIWKKSSTSSGGFNDSKKNLELILNSDYKLCIAIVEPTNKLCYVD